MVLLRFLADILFYLALGLLAYWFFSSDIIALWAAIGSGILSAILFMYTSNIKRSRRNYHSEPLSVYDWAFYMDLLEIPFRIVSWAFKSLWRIFD